MDSNWPPVPVSGPSIKVDDAGRPADYKDWGNYQRGNADGVIYFGAIESETWDHQNNLIIKDVIEVSKDRFAVPFLRPVAAEWLRLNPGKRGWKKPLAWAPPVEMQNAAASAGRSIVVCILADVPGPSDEGGRGKWVWVQTEHEGVWAGFLKRPST